MDPTTTLAENVKQGAEDAGRYFRHMAQFYTNLLDYAPTRKVFLKKDGAIGQDYLQLRMHHLGNFWRRTASGVYDEDYARFVDYVGRAHTSGVFHHKGHGYALRNSCLHRGGPVATGRLEGDLLTCPWHGYPYNVTNGELLLDPNAKLASYPVEVRDGDIHVLVPFLVMDSPTISLNQPSQAPAKESLLQENEFRVSDVRPGQVKRVHLNDQRVAVYNVGGHLYATQEECTHAEGPLSEGELKESSIICPWHDSCFDVTNGQVQRGPAAQPLQTFRVIADGDVARVE